jgi:hypothetical protein
MDPVDFGSVCVNISRLVADTMAKPSCNISRKEIKELVFNSDSEEQCTSKVSDIGYRT